MGDLRIEAKNILKVKKYEKEHNQMNDPSNQDSEIEKQKNKSKEIFIEKIQKEIDNFQTNLLGAANNGETLKIEVVRFDSDDLISWWDERDEDIDSQHIYREYAPIKSGIITFVDDINFDILRDDIIVDSTLQALYDTICNNDIYPEWKVSKAGERVESLYLEVNPLISYAEREASQKRDMKAQQRALVISEQRNNIAIDNLKNEQNIDRLKRRSIIFVSVLYFSVLILTMLTRAVGVVSASGYNDGFSFVEIGWPYFLVSDFTQVFTLFLFSLPVGLLLSLYFAYKSK